MNPTLVAPVASTTGGALVSFTITYASACRSGYGRVTALIQEVSSGEVARARHALGVLATANKDSDAAARLHLAFPDGDEDIEKLRLKAVQSTYTPLWTLGRVDAAARSFICAGTGAEKLLAETLGPWIKWWSSDGRLEKIISFLNDIRPADSVAGKLDVENDKARVDSLTKRWANYR
jgi:hypothetical protein|nr:hypothetical protein [uncultured Actinomyces sp.]